jgi:hypothetical protein
MLADLIREASLRTQLIVATHSDRFIRFLNPDEVVVMDIDEQGLTVASWADTLDLEHWLAEYSLDDVWRMGRMGGAREDIDHCRRKNGNSFSPVLAAVCRATSD